MVQLIIRRSTFTLVALKRLVALGWVAGMRAALVGSS
jgi:hypothetical protein